MNKQLLLYVTVVAIMSNLCAMESDKPNPDLFFIHLVKLMDPEAGDKQYHLNQIKKSINHKVDVNARTRAAVLYPKSRA